MEVTKGTKLKHKETGRVYTVTKYEDGNLDMESEYLNDEGEVRTVRTSTFLSSQGLEENYEIVED